MISKSGPVLHSYQVNTTTETSDEGKNRDDRKNQQNKNSSAVAHDKESSKKNDAPLSAEDDSFTRQLIDSGKVVELLSRVPSTSTVKNPFAKAIKMPLDSERKKVNRNL